MTGADDPARGWISHGTAPLLLRSTAVLDFFVRPILHPQLSGEALPVGQHEGEPSGAPPAGNALGPPLCCEGRRGWGKGAYSCSGLGEGAVQLQWAVRQRSRAGLHEGGTARACCRCERRWADEPSTQTVKRPCH